MSSPQSVPTMRLSGAQARRAGGRGPVRRGLRCTGLSAGVRLRRPRAGRFQLCDAPERAEPRGGEGSASGRGVRGAEGRLGDARAGVGRLAAARGAAAQPGDRRGTRVLWVSARRGRGNAREGSGPVSFSVYCFLDLELERRRPRDYKPSPRVCAEEPRGLAVGSGGHAHPAPPGCSGRRLQPNPSF